MKGLRKWTGSLTIDIFVLVVTCAYLNTVDAQMCHQDGSQPRWSVDVLLVSASAEGTMQGLGGGVPPTAFGRFLSTVFNGRGCA